MGLIALNNVSMLLKCKIASTKTVVVVLKLSLLLTLISQQHKQQHCHWYIDNESRFHCSTSPPPSLSEYDFDVTEDCHAIRTGFRTCHYKDQ